jgi:hypothetical protein
LNGLRVFIALYGYYRPGNRIKYLEQLLKHFENTQTSFLILMQERDAGVSPSWWTMMSKMSVEESPSEEM